MAALLISGTQCLKLGGIKALTITKSSYGKIELQGFAESGMAAVGEPKCKGICIDPSFSCAFDRTFCLGL